MVKTFLHYSSFYNFFWHLALVSRYDFKLLTIIITVQLIFIYTYLKISLKETTINSIEKQLDVCICRDTWNIETNLLDNHTHLGLKHLTDAHFKKHQHLWATKQDCKLSVVVFLRSAVNTPYPQKVI